MCTLFRRAKEGGKVVIEIKWLLRTQVRRSQVVIFQAWHLFCAIYLYLFDLYIFLLFTVYFPFFPLGGGGGGDISPLHITVLGSSYPRPWRAVVLNLGGTPP